MTTKLLEQIRADDQAELAAKHNGEGKRVYRSQWAIDAVNKRIPPEHYRLAQFVSDMQAFIEGVGSAPCERVDCGNRVEARQLSKIDAQRKLFAYEQAVLTRWDGQAVLCLRGIAQGDSMRQMIRRVKLGAHDKELCVELIQATLMVLQQYRDDCAADRTPLTLSKNSLTDWAYSEFAPARSP